MTLTPEQQLHSLLHLIDGIVWEADPHTRRNTFVSHKIEDILGYTAEQWVNTPDFWASAIHPDDHDRVIQEGEDAIRLGRPYQLEYRMLSADGRTVWFRDLTTPVTDQGTLVKLGGVMLDITAQKTAQANMHALKERFTSIFEFSPVGIGITTAHGAQLIDANRAWLDLTGHSLLDIVGKGHEINVYAHEHERDAMFAELQARGSVHDFEYTLRRKDGTLRQVLCSVEPIHVQGQACLLYLTHDITARKHTEQSLAALTDRFAKVFNASPIGIALTGLHSGRVIDSNRTFLDLIGTTHAEFVGTTNATLNPWVNFTDRDELVRRMHQDGTVHDFDTQLYHLASGEIRHVRMSSEQVTLDGEAEDVILLITQDVTAQVLADQQRRAAEAALEASEARYRSLAQNSSDIITVLNKRGELLYVSPSMTSILGHAVDTIVGTNVMDVLDPAEHEVIQAAYAQVVFGGQGTVRTMISRFRTRSGEYRHLEWVATNRLDDPFVQGVVMNARDVTERVRADEALQASQDRLLASEKLASLGRLTAGLAHEINTPLAATMNYLHETETLIGEYRASIGHADVTDDDHRAIAGDLHAAVTNAVNTVSRIGEFIRTMRNHTRDAATGVADFDPVRLVADTLAMLDHQGRKAGVALHLTTPDAALTLRGEPGRFTQVVTNLVVNALHACEDTGLPDRAVTVRFDVTGGQTRMHVTDNGTGVPDDVLPKIFDPMFTTKDVGKGTGLGLSIIHDIVRGHFKGDISVHTTPGTGTTFTVAFP